MANIDGYKQAVAHAAKHLSLCRLREQDARGQTARAQTQLDLARERLCMAEGYGPFDGGTWDLYKEEGNAFRRTREMAAEEAKREWEQSGSEESSGQVQIVPVFQEAARRRRKRKLLTLLNYTIGFVIGMVAMHLLGVVR